MFIKVFTHTWIMVNINHIVSAQSYVSLDHEHHPIKLKMIDRNEIICHHPMAEYEKAIMALIVEKKAIIQLEAYD